METNFFEDVWTYLYYTYFNMGNGYTNLGTESNHLITIGTVVFGLYIGALIACVVMVYNRQIVGSAVRRMLEQKIHSREGALTLSELGYKKNFFIRSMFRDSNSLRRVVKCVEEEDFYEEQNKARDEYEKKREEGGKLPRFRNEIYRVDVEKDHFYIPEDLEITATTKFRKKGSTWVSMIVAIVVLTVVFFALLLFLPWFLGKVDVAFGNIKNGGNG